MASSSHLILSNATKFLLPSHREILSSRIPFQRQSHSLRCSNQTQTPVNSLHLSATRFTWDDVLQISRSEYNSSDLSGYFEKIRICNRNIEKQCDFIPFVMEDQIIGYIHNGFAELLRSFQDVFLFLQDGSCNGPFGRQITLQPTLNTPEDRTSAVGNVIRCLGEEVIPGIRNELYPVTPSFGMLDFFSLERAAAPFFGIKAYGVHMNGYVEIDGQQFLWVGKRSQVKQTFPGMLDHLVAGGLVAYKNALHLPFVIAHHLIHPAFTETKPKLQQKVGKPHGIACGENLIKECKEEAGIPRFISKEAKAVSAISYTDIDGYRFKRDVLFCYDLKLPEDFVPTNEDGEVESFKLIPVHHVANIIRMTRFFKPNCSLVIIDFLFRHGYITPEDAGYLKLLQSLRSGDCS